MLVLGDVYDLLTPTRPLRFLNHLAEPVLNRDLRLEITPSKLLEATDGERLDTLSTGIAGDED
jgi:hypothetical protein